MIVFPCKCGHSFSLPEEKAGGLIQCPQCFLLNDIPTLGDLAGISDEGTYKLDTPIYDEAEMHRLAELQHVFAKEKIDEWGREIDLRPSMEDIGAAGAIEIPLDMHDAVIPGAPKYDPVTGELIRAVDIKPIEGRPAGPIPMAGRAMFFTEQKKPSLGTARIFVELFSGVNVFVMLCILVTHVVLQVMLIAANVVPVLLLPAALVIAGLLMGHYANTIDETGPDEIDELPRPLRHLSWHDDLFGSFVRAATAFLFCYGPALWMLMVGHIPEPVRMALAFIWTIAGTIFFPAVLLTSTTSGSVFNLRPDRVVSVVRRIGWTYGLTLALWLVAAAVYGAGMFGTMGTVGVLFSSDPEPWQKVVFSPLITYPVLALGIYLMHAFCWHMGLLYRHYHTTFPWVLQRHTKRNYLGAMSPPPPPPPALGFQVMPAKPVSTVPVVAKPVQAKPVQAQAVQAMPVQALEPIDPRARMNQVQPNQPRRT